MNRDFFLSGLKLAAAGMIMLLISGWLQHVHPAFDTPSHFRLHLVATLVLSCVILLAFRCWAWVMAGLLVVAVSVGLTLPYLPGLAGTSVQAGLNQQIKNEPTKTNILRVVQANVRFNNSQTHKISKVIAAAKPDIILLQEITRISEGVLGDFEQSHPHQIHCHHSDIGSVAILSRFPLGDPKRSRCLWRLGFARTQIAIDGRMFEFASFHSRWPWPFSQPRQVAALKTEFEALQHPVIVAGDFNSAPWSAIVRKVANMTNTKTASGLYLTWSLPVDLFRKFIGPILPIDQIMISPKLDYLSREVLEDGGSDHYPVLTRINLR